MILTLMLIILTATLVIVIIGFVMDRLEIRKIQSGMRTLNKRIKALESPALNTIAYTEDSYDSQMDTAAEEENGGDIPTEANGEIQETGD